MREAIGPDRTLMIDANQQWDVGRSHRAGQRPGAVQAVVDRGADEPGRRARARDDCGGGAADSASASRPASIARIAIIFKQLLQARAIDFCQIDSCRLGGVNENLAVILMAAKFGVPVCPHAGGVGLCEYVQHLSMFDYIAVTGTMEGRVIEYVDHLHEHFEDPVRHSRRALHGADEARATASRFATRRALAHRYPEGAAWSRGRRTANA